MLNTILEASENFCIHQMHEKYTINNVISKKRTLIAYMDIEIKIAQKHRIYLALEKSFIQRLANLFLEEDESTEETLVDMLLETLNLIAGSAKVIAQERDINSFTISTPKFLKSGVFDINYDETKSLTIKDGDMIIAIKELNG